MLDPETADKLRARLWFALDEAIAGGRGSDVEAAADAALAVVVDLAADPAFVARAWLALQTRDDGTANRLIDEYRLAVLATVGVG